MSEDNLTDLLHYRIKQAYETLNEAGILLKENALRGSVNRSYYAMFYALLALLSTKQMGTSKHSGAISLFDKDFVKKDIFPKEMSQILRIAFDRRHTGDYGEMIEIDVKTAETAYYDSESFIKKIEEYLETQNFFKKEK